MTTFRLTKPQNAYPLEQFGGRAFDHLYGATNRYLTKDGKPWLYRMGEFHFSRYPAEKWETELRKMKAGGIEVVSTYLFWNHHEEVEGEFNFTGDRNLRAFCETCRRVGLPVWLRIGPWAHGEARNGGFPDWLIEKCSGLKFPTTTEAAPNSKGLILRQREVEHTRVSEEPYLSYVRRYWTRVAEELRGCMDLVVGIQVENELAGHAEHMDLLWNMAHELGFRAPFWSATGWGGTPENPSLPEGKMFPMWGGYPEAPWANHVDAIHANDDFAFSDTGDSVLIGNDIFTREGKAVADRKNPFLTCEIGGGVQISYHRRPLIAAADVAAGVICRLGSGCNGIGYYVYHGSRNPIGARSTMQECRVTGYKNDYPVVSYDFQAPLGDCGQVRESYHRLSEIHDFLALCGEDLAPMPPRFPEGFQPDVIDLVTLRAAVRSDGVRGYLFFNNHAHVDVLSPKREVARVECADGEVVEIPLDLPTGSYGVIPFRYPVGKTVARWIKAMPVGAGAGYAEFLPLSGIAPEICLSDGTVLPLTDGMEVGGVAIRLRRPAEWNELRGAPVAVTRLGACRIPDGIFDHLNNRDGTPRSATPCVDFDLRLPDEFTQSVQDANGMDGVNGADGMKKRATYLKIRASGNAAAVYCGSRLVSDQFLCGDVWYVDLAGLPLDQPLTLKLLPLDPSDLPHIYFEISPLCGVCTPVVEVL